MTWSTVASPVITFRRVAAPHVRAAICPRRGRGCNSTRRPATEARPRARGSGAARERRDRAGKTRRKKLWVHETRGDGALIGGGGRHRPVWGGSRARPKSSFRASASGGRQLAGARHAARPRTGRNETPGKPHAKRHGSVGGWGLHRTKRQVGGFGLGLGNAFGPGQWLSGAFKSVSPGQGMAEVRRASKILQRVRGLRRPPGWGLPRRLCL